MTPEEIELWKYAVDEICRAWVIGAIAIAIGISCISIKKCFQQGAEQMKNNAMCFAIGFVITLVIALVSRGC